MISSPKFQHVYHCRYGYNGGRQICIFLVYQGDGYVVRKWRANSARWTDRLVIGEHDLLEQATRADLAKAHVKINIQN